MLDQRLVDAQVISVPIVSEAIPDGLSLRHKLRGHHNIIYEIAWSPDGRTLASASADRTACLWSWQNDRLRETPIGHADYVFCVAWSPDGRILATGANDETIRLSDGRTGEPIRDLCGHTGPIYSIAWSPDGRTLASGSFDRTIRLWDRENDWACQELVGHQDWVMSIEWSPDGQIIAAAARDKTISFWEVRQGKLFRQLRGHHDIVNHITWSPDGSLLASASDDQTVRLWDVGTGRLHTVLEGHTDLVLCVRFSPDGNLLASKSRDGTVRLWRCDTWELVATLNEPMRSDFNAGLAFHPHMPLLATLGAGDRLVRIWHLDDVALLGANLASETWHYRNAKVVLVGDTGVGKSGLGLVLSGRPWVPTGSTHGCKVWTFGNETMTLLDGRQETRETLLWDLAGQPGARLTNQLHLNEVAVALVVFDASNEMEPLAGVRHWDRALRQAARRQGEGALPMKKFLVAARADISGISVWHSRLRSLVREMGFDGYFETSAKEGWQIAELREAIRAGIDWESRPHVSSNELFQAIKQFFIEQKKNGHVLSTTDDLFRLFCQIHPNHTATDLQARFETALSRMENRGLVRRLRFGSYVLLQPELLDAYASDLVNSAEHSKDGLGTLSEVEALNGRYLTPDHTNHTGRQKQKLLLIATVEELIRHEIVLKEPGEHGTDLIFPSKFTRPGPNVPDVPGKVVRFTFEGAVRNIYAILTVRLAHSRLFEKKEMWQNAATFTATVGGTCGVYLREPEEGKGELTLFFDTAASEATRYQFEDYVAVHLERRALPGSITRERLFACDGCGVPVTAQQVAARRGRGFKQMACPVCDQPISLLDGKERLAQPVASAVADMDREADARRDRDVAELILKGKMTTNDYDVFLCYNDADGTAVKTIAEQLRERGILPWLLPPTQSVSEDTFSQIRAAAICVGRGKVPWRDGETVKLLQRFVSQAIGPFIIVALPGCPETMRFPEGILQVDWRGRDTAAMDLLASFIQAKPKYELEK
jgi:WD40 repeat protein